MHNPTVIRSTSPGDVARINVRMPQNENKESNDWGGHPNRSDYGQRETFSLWCCYRFFGNGWMNPLWVVDPWSSKSDCSLRENMAVNMYGKLIQTHFESASRETKTLRLCHCNKHGSALCLGNALTKHFIGMFKSTDRESTSNNDVSNLVSSQSFNRHIWRFDSCDLVKRDSCQWIWDRLTGIYIYSSRSRIFYKWFMSPLFYDLALSTDS